MNYILVIFPQLCIILLIIYRYEIIVTGLPTNLTEEDIASFFGSIGVIKKDKRTGKPKIWIYKNRDTGEQKGEASVTYDDATTAHRSISWFDGKDFDAHTIKVQMPLADQKTIFLSFLDHNFICITSLNH